MAKKTLTTRLDPDTKDEVESYAEDRDIGQTEAARRLIRAGLAAEGHPVAAGDGQDSPLERLASPRTGRLGLFSALTGILIGTAAVSAMSDVLMFGLAIVALALVFLGVILAAVPVIAQIALARPLRGLVMDIDESTA